MTTYENRQEFELDNWPELRQTVNDLVNLVNSERTIPKELDPVTVVAFFAEDDPRTGQGAVRLAEAEVQLREAEYAEATAANEKVTGTYTEAELRRRSAALERARLLNERAKLELRAAEARSN